MRASLLAGGACNGRAQRFYPHPYHSSAREACIVPPVHAIHQPRLPVPGGSNSPEGGGRPAAQGGHRLLLTPQRRQLLLASNVVMSPAEAVPTTGATMEAHLEQLRSFNGDSADESTLQAALASAKHVHETIAAMVNNKSPGIKGLQNAVVGGGAMQALLALARRGHSVAYEALQILCYRNVLTCQTLVDAGVVETMASDLLEASLEQQCSMCFLLTALAAFSDATHRPIISSGLVPSLVALCRTQEADQVVETGQRHATLQTRAASVLRNLAHNQKNHSLLISAGAVEPLVEIMRRSTDPASRINAAVAVACLVGHEEGNPRLQLDPELVGEMLEVLDAACQGALKHGTFWTVWKLCQGLASLTVNDKNKVMITERGGIDILAEVLFGRQHNNEAAHRFALSALWNLAFNERSRALIIETPGLVDAIRNALAVSESTKTKEVAKGALWTLGLEQDVKQLQESAARHVAGGDDSESDTGLQPVQHVMLSYEWGCQQSVMLMKSELQKAGYATWMDIDKMSGSTLEAMAKAVEDSAAVLVCVSKRYKESQACRTEAEYAFQQRKKIIPVLMESDYKPTGWLGALMGTRLYFNLSDPRTITQKMPALFKELGDAGRVTAKKSSSRKAQEMTIHMTSDRPDTWTVTDVEEWLRRIKCAQYIGSFREHGMDGIALNGLLRMSHDSKFIHDTLRTEFGIETFGQRLRVVEELHRLFA